MDTVMNSQTSDFVREDGMVVVLAPCVFRHKYQNCRKKLKGCKILSEQHQRKLKKPFSNMLNGSCLNSNKSTCIVNCDEEIADGDN
jgi:hypothetical protein